MDEDENIDEQAHNEVVCTIGLSNFVLDVLNTVLSKNQFRKQFEMRRNITEITR